ncbi:GxxExxY protein [Lacunimicrobium album]
MEVNEITERIIECSIKVHRVLGPGLLESTYQTCLIHELTKLGLQVRDNIYVPVVYDGITIEEGYRLDVIVEETVIVELKAVEKIHPVHEAQLLSYLKLSDKRVGLLINFNVTLLKDGIKRIVNKYQS